MPTVVDGDRALWGPDPGRRADGGKRMDRELSVLACCWRNLPIERPASPAVADVYARPVDRPAHGRQIMVGKS